MAFFFERTRQCAQKVLDTTDIVREAMFRQGDEDHCVAFKLKPILNLIFLKRLARIAQGETA